jgi:DNA-binding protein HU-beta
MNKTELVSDIAQRANAKKNDVTVFLDAFIDSVKDALKNEDDVRLIGFGTFLSVYVPESDGHSPRDGSPLKIPARYQPKFRPGKGLKDHLNEKK